jgi:hypothetical protein
MKWNVKLYAKEIIAKTIFRYKKTMQLTTTLTNVSQQVKALNFQTWLTPIHSAQLKMNHLRHVAN